MIVFKTIRWKNFLSTGNTFTEIQFNKTDTTLILGENGTGKSTLLDALTFVLFNKPYRSVNLPQLVCSVNEKDCLVEVQLTDGASEYKVVRGQVPKIFEIWKNGKLLDQDSKTKDGQKMLEETILNMNYRSFCQVVILGSANYVPFMRLTAAERRSVVESILDIGVFSSMNNHLKERVSLNKEELQQSESALAVARERVRVLKRMHEEEKHRVAVDTAREEEQVALARVTIAEAKKTIDSSLISVKHFTSAVQNSEDIQNSLDKYTTLKSQINKKMQSLHKEVAFYELNDQCPTCSQKIDEGFKKSVIEKGKNKASEMNSAVNEIADQIDLTQKRLHEIDGIMRKIQDLNTLIMKKMSEIESTEKHIITMVNKKIPQTGNTEKDLHASIDLEQDTLDTKKELIEEQHYLSLAGTLLKDSGIKSRIIKNYIPIINETINKYLTQMNFFVNFNLNEEFNETIKSRHRDVFTYPSFSEGEKKKIDLALLFAWRAIASAKNSITTNLLILDEILDGSLDDQATDSFLDIMGTSKSGTNTFIISHKPKEVLQDKFDRCLQFVKRGNFSRIV